MTHGLDTGFLVAAAVMEHAENAAARDTLARLLSAGDLIAIAPQVLAEFIHTTNPADFEVFGVFTCITPTAAIP